MIALTKSSLVLCCCLLAGARAQDYDYQDQRDQRPQAAGRFISQSNDIKPTPVPILKQVNRHNEDGSYTYGYEGADGSFKIETKSASGEVKGKYGYKDETGKVRVVEYGANQYGFQPAGEGITVAPPTLVDESALEERRQQQQQNQNQNQNQHQQQPQQHQQQHRPKPQQQQQQAYRAPARPAFQSQQDFSQYDEPAPAPRPAHRQSFSAPAPPRQSFFAGAAPAQSNAAPSRAEQPYFRPEPRAQQFNQYQAPSPKPAFEYTQALQFQPKNNNNNNYQQQQYNNPQAFPSPAPVRPAEDRPYVAKQQRPKAYNNHGASMLDQLIQEYGLPQGGSAPLHDITFGSY